MKYLNLFVISLLIIINSCSKTPYTGRTQLILVPDDIMLALSYDTYTQMKQQYQIETGTPRANQLQKVGTRLAKATEDLLRELQMESRIKHLQWEFSLFKADSIINAFCLPGGKIGVYTGILPLTQTEAGLAVVLGHEIGHAIAKHGSERMSQLLVAYMGGVALSVALKEKPEETRNLFLLAYGISSQLGLLAYSRKQELEADRLGLIIMAKAGYDPREAVKFWQRMIKYTGNQQVPEFLSTHPSHQRRITEIKKYLPEALKYYNQSKQ